MTAPLQGLKIIEMAGLGPTPLACYLLASLGADVTRIEARGRDPVFLPLDPRSNPDKLNRTILELDLKAEADREEAIELIAGADVLVEGFRPGAMERLGLGPDEMMALNDRLIYARMTGYGQDGPMAQRAGHDLNYIAMSGVLSMIGRADQPPTPPLNLVGDYGGGTMVLIMGILSSLYARQSTGRGAVIDAAMLEGSAMLAAPIFSFMASNLWQADARGHNLLDSGCPFYDTYETADGRYVAIAPLEPHFFAALVETLDLDPGWNDLQYERNFWPELRTLLAQTFRSRSRDEWAEIFSDNDACVTPVLTPQEAANHPHNRHRESFMELAGQVMPKTAPRFSG